MRTRIVFAALASLAVVSASASAATLRDGTYNCIAGSIRYGTATTPGQIEIRGATFRFHESGKPNDQPFSGYVLNADRTISWHGPMGFMTKNGNTIETTHLDGVAKDSFWFRPDLKGMPPQEAVSCGLITH